MGRTEAFFEWTTNRVTNGVWPYSRTLLDKPGERCRVHDEAGNISWGLNFASQDYLSLASHPAIIDAAAEALRTFGPHSAGSPVLIGNTTLSERLEHEVSEFLDMEHVLLFPTGWAAGFGSITGLVRPYDHVLIDSLGHACLQAGANAATKNVRQFKHDDVEDLTNQLREIRDLDRENGILIVTEGLFSMDSDVPPLALLQSIATEHDATLFVDVAHDLGSMGPHGGGNLAAQSMLGRVDLVMGSFSKTFASNGGFLACNSPAVKHMVKYYGGPHIFSNALSPVQAAVVAEAIRIIRSDEGEMLRRKNQQVSSVLRAELCSRGVIPLGEVSPIIPVPIGTERVARIASKLISERGVLANLVEFPAVAIGEARFRLQCMASHNIEDAKLAAQIIHESICDATELLAK